MTDRIAFPAVHNLEAVQEEAESIELGMQVMVQLDKFVWSIAATYVSIVHPVIEQ